VNFCPRCGTRVTGAYCGQCGASTSIENYQVAPDDTAPTEVSGPPVVAVDADRSEAIGELTSVAPGAEPLVPKVNAAGDVVAGLPLGRSRRSLVIETKCVMVAFLLPAVISAVVVLAQHVSGVADIARFPTIVTHHPFTNMVLGILDYIPVGAVVPIALYLLWRTGQDFETLGLGLPSFKDDVIPGLGIGALSYVCEVIMIAPFAVFLAKHSSLLVNVSTQSVPKYYVIFGIAISAVTSITEEVLVNGYLITRLNQLGWSPRSALILSLILRTSYHVYYGLGFLLTVPFGYFVTRSFQKHHKLNRPIMAHFLYDSILFTISILR
jgi:membrane protease YdiL (CAAX protease family)